MDDFQYFGEWVEYRSEEERIEAKQYLDLWKKFFLRKVPDLEFVEEHFIDRENALIYTFGIKIAMKGKKPENVLSLSDLGPY
jgi:hypothetical protein